MIEFKAYFWNNDVYINKKKEYSTNEILNDYLNLDTSEIHDLIKNLLIAQRSIRFEEDANFDFVTEFNDRLYKAQNLLCKVNDIAKSIAPFNNVKSDLNEQILVDCMNQFSDFFKTSEDSKNDFPEENMYGFRESGDRNSYCFYITRFVPQGILFSDVDTDLPVIMDKANDAVAQIFDLRKRFLLDILRVKNVYASFLDDYIHVKSKFLNEFETAEAFEKYLTKHRNESDISKKLIANGRMAVDYTVLKQEDNKPILCETYTFDSLGAFLYLDFFRGLKSSFLPKRCSNCGKYFLLKAGKYSDYCENPLSDDPYKTCRDVGARKKYDDKCKTDPVWLTYNRAYKAHYARYMKKKMTVSEFEKWSTYAVGLREKAANVELQYDEYYKLIRK